MPQRNPPEKLSKQSEQPLAFVLQLFGNRWKLRIVRELLGGIKHYNELKAAIPPIGSRTLTDHLQEMEDDGLIQRKVATKKPLRVEYSLTELGQTLAPVVNELYAWEKKYRASINRKRRSRLRRAVT